MDKSEKEFLRRDIVKPSTVDKFEKEFLRRDIVKRSTIDTFEKEFLRREVVKRLFGERLRRQWALVFFSLEDVLELSVEQLTVELESRYRHVVTFMLHSERSLRNVAYGE